MAERRALFVSRRRERLSEVERRQVWIKALLSQCYQAVIDCLDDGIRLLEENIMRRISDNAIYSDS
jgi:hypothetical protein